MSFLSDVSKTWLTQFGNSLAVQPYMCLVCSVIQFLLDDRISVFFAVMLLWMHLASLALLPRPGSDSLTQNFLKQSTMMSVGGTLTIDWRSELLASVSLVFFFASIRLMGISSVPITTLDMVASAMESSTMTGGATSSTSSSGSLGDGVLTVLLLFFEGAVALRPFCFRELSSFHLKQAWWPKCRTKGWNCLNDLFNHWWTMKKWDRDHPSDQCWFPFFMLIAVDYWLEASGSWPEEREPPKAWPMQCALERAIGSRGRQKQ